MPSDEKHLPAMVKKNALQLKKIKKLKIKNCTGLMLSNKKHLPSVAKKRLQEAWKKIRPFLA
jgi:hypothetical protein